jgi:hypothetical protein
MLKGFVINIPIYFIHEKTLVYEFLDFLNKTNVFLKRTMSYAIVLFDIMHVHLLELSYRVC